MENTRKEAKKGIQKKIKNNGKENVRQERSRNARNPKIKHKMEQVTELKLKMK